MTTTPGIKPLIAERDEARAACVILAQQLQRHRQGASDPIIEQTLQDAIDEGRKMLAERDALRAALIDLRSYVSNESSVYHASGCHLSRYSPDDCGGKCVYARVRAALESGGKP